MRLLENVIVTNMGGKTVLSKRNDPDGNNICIFNGTGQWIIERIILGETREQIVAELSEETMVEQTVVARDVDAFFNEMVAAGYLDI